MKKFISFFIFVCTFFSFCFVNAKTPSLDEIVKTYNNMEMIKNYANMGASWVATTSDNKLIVTTSSDGLTPTSTEFILEGNILSTSASGDQAFSSALVGNSVVDAVQIIQGYKEGEIYPSLNSKLILNYTLEKEGIELKVSDTEYSLKLDISKKVPLLDLSNEYFFKEDLESFKDYLSGDGSAEGTKGNVYYHKSGYGNDVKLIVAQKNELTEPTYKSIVTLIEVIFNDIEAPSYFVKNYPYLSGNKDFDGCKIEINPVKSNDEIRLFKDSPEYKFVRITIDREAFKKSYTGLNIGDDNTIVTPPVNDTTNDENTNKPNNDVIQSTDDNGLMLNFDNPLIVGGLLLGSALIVLFIGIALIKFKKSKKVSATQIHNEAKNDEDTPKLLDDEVQKEIETPDYMDSSEKINLTSEQEHVVFEEKKKEIDVSNIPFKDEKTIVSVPDYMSTDEKVNVNPLKEAPIVHDGGMVLEKAVLEEEMMSDVKVEVETPNPLDTDINMGPNSDIHVSDEYGVESINPVKAPNSMNTSGIHFESNTVVKTNDSGIISDNKNIENNNTMSNVKAPNPMNTTGINLKEK